MKIMDMVLTPKNEGRRDCILWGVIGAKRKGKTSIAMAIISMYIKKYPNNRVLIYDPADAFKEYETVEYEKLGVRNKNKVLRLVSNPDVFSHRDFLTWCTKNLKNCLLVVDEATSVFEDTTTGPQKELLYKHTNMGVDIITITHGINFVPVRTRMAYAGFTIFDCDTGALSLSKIESLGYRDEQDKLLFLGYLAAQITPLKDNRVQPFFNIEFKQSHNTEKYKVQAKFLYDYVRNAIKTKLILKSEVDQLLGKITFDELYKNFIIRNKLEYE